MPARFTVLASGSSGNASLLEADGFGLLIDCGLRPDVLAQRLDAAGASWQAVHAVLLTHTHGDHWNPYTLAHLRTLSVPLFAHPRHHDALSRRAEHDPLRRAGLARPFDAGRWFDPGPAVACYAVEVPHDSAPTFAFRIESRAGDWAVGFASDVGTPTAGLRDAVAGVDVLAVEYNHDVPMQKASRRPQMLIDRVLGSHGHLSNRQAADLTEAVAADGQLRAVVQLHLSRECNTPELASAAGRAALRGRPGATLVTASQHAVAAAVPLSGVRPQRTTRAVQPTLPGL